MAYNGYGGGGMLPALSSFVPAAGALPQQSGSGMISHSYSLGDVRAAGQVSQRCRIGKNDVPLAHQSPRQASERPQPAHVRYQLSPRAGANQIQPGHNDSALSLNQSDQRANGAVISPNKKMAESHSQSRLAAGSRLRLNDNSTQEVLSAVRQSADLIKEPQTVRNSQLGHRKLFKSPKVEYFLQQFEYDRNKNVIETERAKAANERRFQYYNEVKERQNKRRKAGINRALKSASPGGVYGGPNSTRDGGGSSSQAAKPVNYLHQQIALKEARLQHKLRQQTQGSHSLSQQFAGHNDGSNKTGIRDFQPLDYDDSDSIDVEIEAMVTPDLSADQLRQQQDARRKLGTKGGNSDIKQLAGSTSKATCLCDCESASCDQHRPNQRHHHSQVSCTHCLCPTHHRHHQLNSSGNKHTVATLPVSIHQDATPRQPSQLLELVSNDSSNFYAISPLEQLQSQSRGNANQRQLNANDDNKRSSRNLLCTEDNASLVLQYGKSLRSTKHNNQLFISYVDSGSDTLERQSSEEQKSPQPHHSVQVISPRRVRVRNLDDGSVKRAHLLTSSSVQQLPVVTQSSKKDNSGSNLFNLASQPLLQSMPVILKDGSQTLIQTSHQPQYHIIKVRKQKSARKRSTQHHCDSKVVIVAPQGSLYQTAMPPMPKPVIELKPVQDPSPVAPQSLWKPRAPRPDTLALLEQEEPQPVREIMLTFPEEWRHLFRPKRKVYSPPRTPDEEEMPLKKAYHEYLSESPPEREAPKLMEIMGWPTIKLRPKKVSPQEPVSLDFASQHDQDQLWLTRGEIEGMQAPFMDEILPRLTPPPVVVIEPSSKPEPRPETPPSPKIDKKKKKRRDKPKKQSSRVVKVVTEVIEQPEEPDEEETKKKEKPRANKLPPVEILFAHLDRVDTMNKKVEPALTAANRSISKKQASFHHTQSQATFNDSQGLKKQKSTLSRSLTKRKSKSRFRDDDIDLSGSQSPGSRIGSDTGNNANNSSTILEQAREESDEGIARQQPAAGVIQRRNLALPQEARFKGTSFATSQDTDDYLSHQAAGRAIGPVPRGSINFKPSDIQSNLQTQNGEASQGGSFMMAKVHSQKQGLSLSKGRVEPCDDFQQKAIATTLAMKREDSNPYGLTATAPKDAKNFHSETY